MKDKIEKIYLDNHLLAADPELVARLEAYEDKINEIIDKLNTDSIDQ